MKIRELNLELFDDSASETFEEVGGSGGGGRLDGGEEVLFVESEAGRAKRVR